MTRKAIERLAATHGLTIKWRRNPKRMWEPRTKTIFRESESDAIHEIAHYLCASKNRRKMVNYGLGEDYEFLQVADSALSFACSSKEEAAASLLGIMIEKALGMNWQETAKEHNWYDLGHCISTARRLRKRGLLRHVKAAKALREAE